jgi:type 1 glutamine amidotransferase
VSIARGAAHPILSGIEGPFHVRSWLYRVGPKWPPADARPLLVGRAVDPERDTPDDPVAWTWTNRHGGRAFFTTLGHPQDFAAEPFQRLVLSAIHWALGRPVPGRWKGRLPWDVAYEGIRRTARP